MADFFKVRWRRPRKDVKPPELNQYPATPAAYYSSFYPGSLRVKAYRIRYTIKFESLTLSYYAPSPASSQEFPSWDWKFNQTDNRTNRRRIDLPELNQYTPSGLYLAGFFPGSKIAEGFRISFNRKIQRLPELNQYPETPVDYYSGFYPGSTIATNNRYAFDVKRQRLPELNSYPLAVSTADVTAWLYHFEKTRNKTNRRFLALRLDEYPEAVTSAVVYPSIVVRPTLRWKRVVRLQKIIHITPIPATPVPVWTKQTDSADIWTGQTDSTDTWTNQSDSADTWTAQ